MRLIKKQFDVKTCQRCRLSAVRRHVVEGRGVKPADILFIGEAPGTSEDLLGEAFVGASGKLLDQMIEHAGLTDVPTYFTNTVLCRPADGRGASSREPREDEVLACRDNVLKIVLDCQPLVIILVGDIAEKYFSKTFEVTVVKIQHPSFLLRQGGVRSPYYMANVKKLEAVKNDLHR